MTSLASWRKAGHTDTHFLLLSCMRTRKVLETVFLHRVLVLIASDILKVCPL